MDAEPENIAFTVIPHVAFYFFLIYSIIEKNTCERNMDERTNDEQ